MSETSFNYVDILPFPKCNERLTQLKEYFFNKYNVRPDYFVRVPGRVNLIGEHIDYCGYGVCPMGLDQSIIIAVTVIPNVENTLLKLSNIDSKYEDAVFSIPDITVDVKDGAPKWFNYFLCGVKGIQDYLKCADLGFGLNVAVSGNIPPGSGLSSSSALVCSSVLTLAHAKQLKLSKQELADISAACERYIGTQGGGMDQAIAFLATEGCAKLINFSPLITKDVVLPPGAVFVISHSLTRLNKAATSDFNCRVMECKLATKLLAKKNGLEWEKISIFKDLQEQLNVSVNEMISIVNKCLHLEPYTKKELCTELDLTIEQFENLLSFNTKHLNEFRLKQRALHVFAEAQRVNQFYEICSKIQSNEVITNVEDVLRKLGQILNESHKSLQHLYECSHENLDKIVDLSKEIAFGARLTGAGWGGCVVALVNGDKVSDYIEILKNQFYLCKLNDVDNLENLIFATSPKAGACIYSNQ